jgi:hypothetical protein
MSPPFGNAAIATSQQTFWKLSRQDISTPQTDRSSLNDVLTVEKPKWKVKWKISRSALLQRTTASKSTPSNTFSTLSQAAARPTTNCRESSGYMQNYSMPTQNPFIQRTDVHTINMGNNVANILQIVLGNGVSNWANMAGQQVPFFGYPPPVVFHGGYTPAGAPGLLGHSQTQHAFHPYPQNSDQFGHNVNGVG